MKISYTNSTVAYLDILGFSDLVRKGGEGTKQIDEIKNLLNCIAHENGTPEKPQALAISDCVILSNLLEEIIDTNDGKAHSSMTGILVYSLLFSQACLLNGFLLHGGIDVGDVWHVQNDIVGPSYINAHELESKEAFFPRILLSDNAFQAWKDCPDCVLPLKRPSITVQKTAYYWSGNDSYSAKAACRSSLN